MCTACIIHGQLVTEAKPNRNTLPVYLAKLSDGVTIDRELSDATAPYLSRLETETAISSSMVQTSNHPALLSVASVKSIVSVRMSLRFQRGCSILHKQPDAQLNTLPDQRTRGLHTNLYTPVMQPVFYVKKRAARRSAASLSN